MIPTFEPEIGEDDIEAVVAALRRGEISGSFGDTISLFEQEFAAYCGVKHCVTVGNGLDALYLALKGYDVGAGD